MGCQLGDVPEDRRQQVTFSRVHTFGQRISLKLIMQLTRNRLIGVSIRNKRCIFVCARNAVPLIGVIIGGIEPRAQVRGYKSVIWQYFGLGVAVNPISKE